MVNDKERAKDLAKAVGLNTHRLRKLQGWSQTELAKRVGASYVQINRVENGHNLPSSDLLYLLADVFGVSTDTLRQTTLLHDSENLAQTA